MKEGMLRVLIAAVLFAAAIFLIFHFFGLLAVIAAYLIMLGIFAFILVFLLLFAFGFVLFFAAIFYFIKKKPTVTPGEYTLDMQKGKNEK